MPRRTLRFDPIDEARRQWNAHGWTDAAPGMAFVTSIMRVQQILLARVDEVLAAFDLTFARFELLQLLAFSRSGALPLGKVGERLQVHPASVTNVVDRLERQGLVRRVPHATDGRMTLGELTPAGRRVVAKAAAALNDEVFRALGVDDAALDDATALLREVRRAAGDFA